MSPRREWMSVLVLADRNVPWSAPRMSTGGAVVLARDVLAGPPGSYQHDESAPDGRGEWVQPTTWTDGVHSDAPDLLDAIGAMFGRRPAMPGRMGVRACYARVSTWPRQLPDVAAGVELATSPVWESPRVVLVLHTRTDLLDAVIRKAFPRAAVRWVAPDKVRPMECARVLYGARKGKAGRQRFEKTAAETTSPMERR